MVIFWVVLGLGGCVVVFCFGFVGHVLFGVGVAGTMV